MSLPFSQGKFQGEERKKVVQSVQEQAKVTIRAAIRPVLEEFLETEVTAKLGREKGEDRRIRSQPRQIDWQCGKCGCTVMRTSSFVTVIIVGDWQQDGDSSAICVCRWWSAKSVGTML